MIGRSFDNHRLFRAAKSEEIKTRAVDVSPALNNCFFHALALHLLGNNLPFPADLFIIHGADSDALKQLKNLINQNQDQNLALFSRFQFNSLFEKIIIFGICLRSWMQGKLFQNLNQQKALFKSIESKQGFNDITFMSIINHFIEAKAKNDYQSFRLAVSDHPIFESNKSYIQNQNMKDEGTHLSYWSKEGYHNYCQYLGKNIKLSYNEFNSIFTEFDFPFKLYAKSNSKEIASSKGKQKDKTIEIALDELEGHYFLLKTENTAFLLKEYLKQQRAYKKESKRILELESDKIKEVYKSNYPFVVALWPFYNGDIVAFLAKQVHFIYSKIKSSHLAPISALSSRRLNQNSSDDSNNSSYSSIEDEQSEEQVVSTADQQEEFNYQVENLFYLLDQLYKKGKEFAELAKYDSEYEGAKKAAFNIHKEIKDQLRKYINSEKDQKAVDQFKKKCHSIISENRKALDDYDATRIIITNLIVALFTGIIPYLLIVAANVGYNYLASNSGKLRCSFWQSDAGILADELEDAIVGTYVI